MVSSRRSNNNHKRKVKKLPKYLEKTKIGEMLERARNDNKRNYLILLTLWRTGIRNSELVNLKKGDIKTDELTIRQGKGHKDRVVPLETHLSDLLQYHVAKLPLDNLVFPLTTPQIRNIVHIYQPNNAVHKTSTKNLPRKTHLNPCSINHSINKQL